MVEKYRRTFASEVIIVWRLICQENQDRCIVKLVCGLYTDFRLRANENLVYIVTSVISTEAEKSPH